MSFDSKRKKIILVTIITFVINFGLDRLTKILAVEFLKGNPPKSFLGGIFKLIYAENTGAFLSMGANFPIVLKYILLAIIPILVCLWGLYWCLFKEKDTFRCVLFTSVIAGGLGNLLDRLFNSFRVIDFMNFGIGNLRTGILNIADISITFGVLIFIVYDIFFAKDKLLADEKKEKSTEPEISVQNESSEKQDSTEEV